MNNPDMPGGPVGMVRQTAPQNSATNCRYLFISFFDSVL